MGHRKPMVGPWRLGALVALFAGPLMFAWYLVLYFFDDDATSASYWSWEALFALAILVLTWLATRKLGFSGETAVVATVFLFLPFVLVESIVFVVGSFVLAGGGD